MKYRFSATEPEHFEDASRLLRTPTQALFQKGLSHSQDRTPRAHTLEIKPPNSPDLRENCRTPAG
jgi:hypothetical protein